MRYSFAVFAAVFVFVTGIFAQNGLPDTGIKSNLVIGVVKIVGTEKIVLETKDGSIDAVILTATVFKRMSPENLSLSAAEDSAIGDISTGDRVLVTGNVSEDKKSVYANKVFLVKGSDIEAQLAKRRADWQKRGISGKVTEMDAATNTLTVRNTNFMGAESFLKVMPKDDAVFKRYSQKSPRYSDAVESSYTAISVGDNLQALGDKSADGATFAAEEILTGAFITVGGKVKSIDSEKNEVTIEDLTSGGDITIAVVDTSMLKRFPEEVAQRLARFQAMGGAAAMSGSGGGGGQRPGGGQGAGPGGGMRPGGGQGMGDINDMLNRFPSISVSELKVGELIAVSSPKPQDPTRITAIKLLAGVGPFLAAMPSSGGRNRGRGVSAGINVPGLDSFDF